MKIMATVNFGKNQLTQAWDFIPYDEATDEDAVLILAAFKNGDIVGIPLVNSRIKKIENVDEAKFACNGVIKSSDGELIPRVGKAN